MADAELLPVLPRKSNSGPRTDRERNTQIVAMFRAGATQAEIGDVFGITPVAVGQTLKRYGVSRFEGGKSKLARIRRAEQAARAAQKEVDDFIASTGASPDDFASLEELKFAHQRFREQRMRAGQRHIGWEMTFAEWWAIWQASGKWHLRGRQHAGSAVMARRGDIGPYSASNVYIITLAANFRESWISAPSRARRHVAAGQTA
jgi:transcriptional regulator with XRE-family HTH domain